MILSCRFLTSVSSANDFTYGGPIAEFTEGDALTLYIQLIDASKDKGEDGYQPAGRRYMPAAAATLSVTIDNIDASKKVTRSATQPFPLDPSIWAVSILSTDKIRGTATLRLSLTEGSKVTSGKVIGALRVQSKNAL